MSKPNHSLTIDQYLTLSGGRRQEILFDRRPLQAAELAARIQNLDARLCRTPPGPLRHPLQQELAELRKMVRENYYTL